MKMGRYIKKKKKKINNYSPWIRTGKERQHNFNLPELIGKRKLENRAIIVERSN